MRLPAGPSASSGAVQAMAALLLVGALLAVDPSAEPSAPSPPGPEGCGAPRPSGFVSAAWSSPSPASAYSARGSLHHRTPTGLISVSGASIPEKKSNTSIIMSAAVFAPPPLLGADKNLSSFPRNANLDLVDLFYVFFKPNRLLATMAVVQPGRFTLRDTSQKVVLLVRNRLVASLQTSNKPPAEISVVPNPYLDADAFPIIMGIGDETLSLCSERVRAERPALRLENRHIMDVYRDSSGSAKCFTFTCKFNSHTQRFESVAFPGWFLSTSQHSNEPVRLTNQLGTREITDFYFRKV